MGITTSAVSNMSTPPMEANNKAVIPPMASDYGGNRERRTRVAKEKGRAFCVPLHFVGFSRLEAASLPLFKSVIQFAITELPRKKPSDPPPPRCRNVE
ncbi:hypothetical protein PMIN02_012144 [Paraphaeosphaeria minitans]